MIYRISCRQALISLYFLGICYLSRLASNHLTLLPNPIIIFEVRDFEIKQQWFCWSDPEFCVMQNPCSSIIQPEFLIPGMGLCWFTPFITPKYFEGPQLAFAYGEITFKWWHLHQEKLPFIAAWLSRYPLVIRKPSLYDKWNFSVLHAFFSTT